VATDTSKPKRSFWMHQLAEYLIGAAMVGSGLQSPSPLVPSVLGALIILNTAIVDAPFGAFRVVGRRTHRILDFVVLGAIAVGALMPGVDAATRLIILALGVILAVVVFGTNYGAKALAEGKASVADGGRSEDIGRYAGRLTAKGIQTAKKKLG
jgi:hypothetical protein